MTHISLDMSHLTLPDLGHTDTVTVDMVPVVPVVLVVLCQLTTTTEVRTLADLCRNIMHPRYVSHKYLTI